MLFRCSGVQVLSSSGDDEAVMTGVKGDKNECKVSDDQKLVQDTGYISEIYARYCATI
jgi:hypothetical protein